MQAYHNLNEIFSKVPGISWGSPIWALMATECLVSATSHPNIMSIILVICRSRSCWGWCCYSLWGQNSSSSFWRLFYKWKHDSTKHYRMPTFVCLLLLHRVWGQQSSSSFKRLPYKWKHDQTKHSVRPPLLSSGGRWTWIWVSGSGAGSAWEEVKILKTKIKTLFIEQFYVDQWMCSL